MVCAVPINRLISQYDTISSAGFLFLRNVLPVADQAERLPTPIAILSVIAADSPPTLGAAGERWTGTWLYRAGHFNKLYITARLSAVTTAGRRPNLEIEAKLVRAGSASWRRVPPLLLHGVEA
jgi:hypothetical protein